MKEGGSEGGFLSLKTPMGIITSAGDGDEIRARYRRLPRHSKVSLRLSRPSLLPCAISRSAPPPRRDVVPKVPFLNIALEKYGKMGERERTAMLF